MATCIASCGLGKVNEYEAPGGEARCFDLAEDEIGDVLMEWGDERVAAFLKKFLRARPNLTRTLLHGNEQEEKMREVAEPFEDQWKEQTAGSVEDVKVIINDDADKAAVLANTGITTVEIKKETTSRCMREPEWKPPPEPCEEEPEWKPPPAPCEEPTIIQLSSFMYFCDEDEAVIGIDVTRFGDVSKRSEVCYTTRDGTAKAGVGYHSNAGMLIFEPGEREKTVEVELISSDKWSGTLEFVIELLQDNLKGAMLGRYLYQTRVKIIDRTCFPSDKYRSQILEDKLSEIPKWLLLLEYIKFNWSNPVVRWGTKKMIMMEQLHNLYFIMKLFLNVYMIDYILNLDRSTDSLLSKDRVTELLMLVVLTMLPFAILHIMDYKKLTWKVGGASRLTLQRGLLRKFLNYDENSRATLNDGEIIMAMARDVGDVVTDGYMSLIAFSKLLGQLLMIFLFQVTSPLVFGTDPRPLAYLPLTTFPFILVAFLIFRRAKTNTFEMDRDVKQDALIDRVNRTVHNYRLIADYNQRPFFVSWFESVVKQFNVSTVDAAQVLKNNEYFAPWVTLLFVCGYTIVGGMQVFDHTELSLGMFLTNLQIFNAIGQANGSIYKVLLTAQSSFGGLMRIVHLLNLPIDLAQRKQLSRHRRSMTGKLRAEARERKPDFKGTALDLLPIRVENLRFAYKGSAHLPGLAAGQLNVCQGKLISLVGPVGEGKSTLLKILGGVILPTEGDFFVPSHLRVLHVSSETLFCQGTLMKNLVFGIDEKSSDAQPDRVRKICCMLGLRDDVLKYVDSGQVLPWTEVLSQTSRYLVSLARALIANPEVLCIHKPTLALDEKSSHDMMSVLKSFVARKGIEQDDATFHLRRPRTCIMTSAKMLGVRASDQVYRVSAKSGIELINQDDIKDDMLG